MTAPREEIRQRLVFIDRTIFHAVRACGSDASVPSELKDCVKRMCQRSTQAQQAWRSFDERGMRETVDDLARISDEAQTRLHPCDGMNYELKSAVILTHIELSALQYQLA
jgi:hypothetical protein